ncbi:unnamed protein product [Penicillium nalgiovense]|nr:unnamed protein product [Penicillium nalgiovense]
MSYERQRAEESNVFKYKDDGPVLAKVRWMPIRTEHADRKMNRRIRRMIRSLCDPSSHSWSGSGHYA